MIVLALLQNATDSHAMLLAWVTANSLALVGVVYKAGQLVNRLENLERRAESMWKRYDQIHDLPIKFDNLCERVDTLQEGQDKISNSLDSIKESVFKLTYQKP